MQRIKIYGMQTKQCLKEHFGLLNAYIEKYLINNLSFYLLKLEIDEQNKQGKQKKGNNKDQKSMKLKEAKRKKINKTKSQFLEK